MAIALKKSILMVSQTPSYLTMALGEKLEANRIRCIHVVCNLDYLNAVQTHIDAVLIYADSKLLDEKQVLVFIKDRAMELNIPVFIIGSPQEIEIIENFIPVECLEKVYTRPVNVSDVAGDVSNYFLNATEEIRKKILVVDDSGAMLRSVKGWLEGKYQVILANSGAMAIKYLTLNRPDLVLLDYDMPVVDGKMVLEMIRSEDDFCDVPVVFLTGKGDEKSVRDVMSLNPEGYLLKTQPSIEIIRFVDRFFARKEFEEENNK
ncbi:MAG: response regulator [Lachnospiraceae bacterium]|nr:response regulator [Lachnospiraceae bacterium]